MGLVLGIRKLHQKGGVILSRILTLIWQRLTERHLRNDKDFNVLVDSRIIEILASVVTVRFTYNRSRKNFNLGDTHAKSVLLRRISIQRIDSIFN